MTTPPVSRPKSAAIRSRPDATRSVVACVQSPDHVMLALLGERLEVGDDVLRREAVRARLVLRVEPGDQEVADQELVAGHVPEQQAAARPRGRSRPARGSTSGRSRPSGSKRRFSTLRTSRAQLRLEAPIVLSRSSRWRFSSFVSEKSHAANAAYVSSIERALDDRERRDDARSRRRPRQSASLA